MSEQNDKLMEPFIEKAAPRLLDALKDSIAKQIEESTRGLKESATRMLDEIKDTKRAAAEKDDALAATTKLLAALDESDRKRAAENAGIDRFFKAADTVRLTRTQARDPKIYREAKAAAEKAGTRLEITDDE